MELKQHIFEDRADAGRKLARHLAGLPLGKSLVATIPPTGVPTALEVARDLKVALELLVVLEIPAPLDPEAPIGFGVGGAEPHIIMDEERAKEYFIPPGYVDEESRKLIQEADRLCRIYMPNHRPAEVGDHDVILVADTDVSLMALKAAAEALKRASARSVTLAMPLITREIEEAMTSAVQSIVSLRQIGSVSDVARHYRTFDEVPETLTIDLDEAQKAD